MPGMMSSCLAIIIECQCCGLTHNIIICCACNKTDAARLPLPRPVRNAAPTAIRIALYNTG